MTDEIGRRPATSDAVFCDGCKSALRIERKQNQTLLITCACGDSRSLKVASVLPDGWMDD